MKGFVVFLCCWYAGVVYSSVYITISGANVKKAKFALGQVHLLPTATEANVALAKKVREELRSDLEFSQLFDFVSDENFAEYDKAKDLYDIKYEGLASVGSSFLLKLGYRVQGGKLFLEAILYDVAGKKKIFGTRYQYQSSQYYRLVHTLAEDIIQELTGERGLFLSRVVMVCWSKTQSSPNKEIFVVDTDGRNLTQLTYDNTLSLSPSWSPDGKFITYTQYEWRRFGKVVKKGTVLKRHNLQTGDRKTLSAREGMNSGAQWTVDGTKIAATLSFTGRPEIFFLNPNGSGDPEPFSRNVKWTRVSGELQEAALNLLFDVEPSFSPDGKKLVLSSARSGHPMIYTVDLGTKVATQLTYAGQYNASPAWSPRGDKIMFAAQRTGDGNFDLFLIDPDGNNLARITNGERTFSRGINSENPTWAPTGRHFAFANNEGGAFAIYIMALDGVGKRRISPTDKECKTPAWGPKEG